MLQNRVDLWEDGAEGVNTEVRATEQNLGVAIEMTSEYHDEGPKTCAAIRQGGGGGDNKGS